MNKLKINQDKIFSNYEGNNWFKRNKDYLKTENDLPLNILELYKIRPNKVLEIGASNGYRLADIYKRYKSEVHAAEPSDQAIKEGKSIYKMIKFQRSTAEKMKYKKNYFDLIILYSVMHWIDRENLLNSIAKIDQCLNWNGYIIIGDFQIYSPFKRRYHHIKGSKIYTYKIDYTKIFTSTGIYKLITNISKNHDTNKLSGDTNINNYFSVSLLKKEDLYLEIKI